jgi:hypothetical protein
VSLFIHDIYLDVYGRPLGSPYQTIEQRFPSWDRYDGVRWFNRAEWPLLCEFMPLL